jgi:hypothetical protein
MVFSREVLYCTGSHPIPADNQEQLSSHISTTPMNLKLYSTSKNGDLSPEKLSSVRPILNFY